MSRSRSKGSRQLVTFGVTYRDLVIAIATAVLVLAFANIPERTQYTVGVVLILAIVLVLVTGRRQAPAKPAASRPKKPATTPAP